MTRQLHLDFHHLTTARGSGYEASSIYDLEPGMAAQDWHYGRANNGIGGSGDAGPAAKLDNVES